MAVASWRLLDDHHIYRRPVVSRRALDSVGHLSMGTAHGAGILSVHDREREHLRQHSALSAWKEPIPEGIFRTGRLALRSNTRRRRNAVSGVPGEDEEHEDRPHQTRASGVLVEQQMRGR